MFKDLQLISTLMAGCGQNVQLTGAPQAAAGAGDTREEAEGEAAQAEGAHCPLSLSREGGHCLRAELKPLSPPTLFEFVPSKELQVLFMKLKPEDHTRTRKTNVPNQAPWEPAARTLPHT